MSCPSRDPARPLTRNQADQLQALLAAEALDRDSGAPPERLAKAGMCHPLVIGALRDKGLAESRSRRAKKRSWTEYWLTPAGALKARELAEAAPPPIAEVGSMTAIGSSSSSSRE